MKKYVKVSGYKKHDVSGHKIDDHKCIASCDWAANYAKVLKNGHVEVITLYRYGKPACKVWTKKAFIAWINEIGAVPAVDLLGLEVA